MATKLPKNTYPTGHGPNDFSCFGPAATKDSQFAGTLICDMGCFFQDGKDSNKYYHASVVLSKINGKWYVYFEWGRQGVLNPSFQFIECLSKTEAENEYEKQLHAKNDKRGEWYSHPVLGKTLRAKAGKDCYLVRPQATRSTGLPDARTIKEGVKNIAPSTAAANKSKYDQKTMSLMHDLGVATVAYTKGTMADSSLPTNHAINEARDILNAALSRVGFVGDQIENQVQDKELIQLTNLLYSRIPKKKNRGDAATTWILSKNNIGNWHQDLDAFESALATVDLGVESKDPFGGLNIEMEWLDPRSPFGEFIHYWAPKATLNKHSYITGPMKIKNVWRIVRKDEVDNLAKEQARLRPYMPKNFYHCPNQQPSTRPDLTAKENALYKETNTALLFHGTRSVNISGLLREGFRFPKELINVHITAAMFSGGNGGIYYADDYKKSVGYTSYERAYYSKGSGSVAGRGAFLFLCDTLLGNAHLAEKAFPYVDYPNGTHCIFGKGGHTKGRNFILENNEWIVLKKPQYRFRYLLEFGF